MTHNIHLICYRHDIDENLIGCCLAILALNLTVIVLILLYKNVLVY